MATDKPTHIQVSTPAPGDGEVVGEYAAKQGRSGKRILLVLGASLGAAILILGVFLAVSAPKLQSADATSGGTSGQHVTDQAATTFNTPETAPKTNPPATPG